MQEIYDFLRGQGMTHEGALGVMGNLQAESGCESCRLQGDFELSRTRSKEYAEAVDSGQISRHVFSRDGMGWGIYQLTYWSRKEGFYDYCKEKGKSIADLTAQLAYLCKEMRTDYFSLFSFLGTTHEMFTACKRVMQWRWPLKRNYNRRKKPFLLFGLRAGLKKECLGLMWKYYRPF